MLSENIRAIRRSKGLSQEELAIKVHVVRQTISKWEKGLSVPDSEMLISLSEALATPVRTLLGAPVTEERADDLQAISEKLAIVNAQLARREAAKRTTVRRLLVAWCAAVVVLFAVLVAVQSPYLGWNYGDPETAVFGASFHVFEWLFVRLAPLAFLGGVVGLVLVWKCA